MISAQSSRCWNVVIIFLCWVAIALGDPIDVRTSDGFAQPGFDGYRTGQVPFRWNVSNDTSSEILSIRSYVRTIFNTSEWEVVAPPVMDSAGGIWYALGNMTSQNVALKLIRLEVMPIGPRLLSNFSIPGSYRLDVAPGRAPFFLGSAKGNQNAVVGLLWAALDPDGPVAGDVLQPVAIYSAFVSEGILSTNKFPTAPGFAFDPLVDGKSASMFSLAVTHGYLQPCILRYTLLSNPPIQECKPIGFSPISHLQLSLAPTPEGFYLVGNSLGFSAAWNTLPIGAGFAPSTLGADPILRVVPEWSGIAFGVAREWIRGFNVSESAWRQIWEVPAFGGGQALVGANAAMGWIYACVNMRLTDAGYDDGRLTALTNTTGVEGWKLSDKLLQEGGIRCSNQSVVTFSGGAQFLVSSLGGVKVYSVNNNSVVDVVWGFNYGEVGAPSSPYLRPPIVLSGSEGVKIFIGDAVISVSALSAGAVTESTANSAKLGEHVIVALSVIGLVICGGLLAVLITLKRRSEKRKTKSPVEEGASSMHPSGQPSIAEGDSTPSTRRETDPSLDWIMTSTMLNSGRSSTISSPPPIKANPLPTPSLVMGETKRHSVLVEDIEDSASMRASMASVAPFASRSAMNQIDGLDGRLGNMKHACDEQELARTLSLASITDTIRPTSSLSRTSNTTFGPVPTSDDERALQRTNSTSTKTIGTESFHTVPQFPSDSESVLQRRSSTSTQTIDTEDFHSAPRSPTHSFLQRSQSLSSQTESFRTARTRESSSSDDTLDFDQAWLPPGTPRPIATPKRNLAAHLPDLWSGHSQTNPDDHGTPPDDIVVRSSGNEE
ncbi:uncharacterized protein SPPG_05162 [Spizellomyces punctatus DAOM BR117]|uniref:Peptidase A1 domain-containing protein n=1 Tax=Spizellomyces punctatus (strain DAOM BR117) TaxID=645134 RepID=A0A0L0HFT3_SPIPD|nr:uncharacterized protein SPPG_05162 [Spizellomyces punctatus DAOM BR117]KNC99784.1 hypothetical protein SPPG_05162 [Spizellomyces punctatus DAOM BR117]|eukprot:XP_016607824.1 hypothetical protein SPPG_05162 [Spizellomyces punctatus DAOM BR117]